MKNKIAIIGAGYVGSTISYALMQKNLTSEIILIDKNKDKCDGEVRDLSDAVPFSETSRVSQGDLKEASKADIIIITAGTGHIKPGQTRLDLIDINKKIMEEIITQMQPLNPEAIIIIVSNPVDILTLVVQQISKLPINQVIGSGTLLDTQRLKGYLSEKLVINESSIHAFVLGEHGNSQFVAWSHANVAGIPIKDFKNISQKELKKIEEDAMKEAYTIISEKGATYYGIASCVTQICESIIFDQNKVLPISSYHENLEVSLSMPTVIGNKGVKKVLDLPLNPEEKTQLQNSVKTLKQYLS